jgi:hypothetical protein
MMFETATDEPTREAMRRAHAERGAAFGAMVRAVLGRRRQGDPAIRPCTARHWPRASPR